MQVLKFGGSSIGSESAIANVVEIVTESLQNKPCIVVVSLCMGLQINYSC
jgi:aspartokinase